MQQAGTAVYKLDDMDFGRRIAVERELERGESGPGGALRSASAVYDESGNILLYPTMLGIKGERDRVYGSDDSDQCRDQQGRAGTREGRILTIPQLGIVSGCTREEGCNNTRDGSFGKSSHTGQSRTGSTAVLHRI